MAVPDPRAARSRAAVLAAARALLQEDGPGAVTHQRVAARAGVGRATVYRHWPEPATLLRDAMAQVDLPFFADFHAGLHDWLRRELRRLADQLALPLVRQVAATLVQSAQWDPAARQQLDQWLDLVTRRLQQALAAATAGGEIDPPAGPADPVDAAALLLGPLFSRTVLQGGTVSDALLDHVLATAVPPRRGSDLQTPPRTGR